MSGKISNLRFCLVLKYEYLLIQIERRVFQEEILKQDTEMQRYENYDHCSVNDQQSGMARVNMWGEMEKMGLRRWEGLPFKS